MLSRRRFGRSCVPIDYRRPVGYQARSLRPLTVMDHRGLTHRTGIPDAGPMSRPTVDGSRWPETLMALVGCRTRFPRHSTAKPTIVFDIDGTVSDCRHRLHYLSGSPKDWESFFAASATDMPLARGVELARSLRISTRIIWVTGRPERFRDLTVAWLDRHGLPVDTLHMRPDDDRRPAPIFKTECVTKIAETEHIQMIVDDDDHVVAALRAAGWCVKHARWMSI